jgi:hypothetical protein
VPELHRAGQRSFVNGVDSMSFLADFERVQVLTFAFEGDRNP